MPGANAWPPSSSHDATTVPEVLPVHPTSQETLNFTKYIFFGSERHKNAPRKGKSRHIDRC